MTPTYLLVHGSNSNSFSWAPLQRELALRGHRTLAVDLPGHGYGAAFSTAYQAPQHPEEFAVAPSTLACATLADAVAHVVCVVREAAEHGPVVLVGHSRGGLTVTGAGNAVPEMIDHVVYMSAWCCVDLTPAEYQTCPEMAGSLLGDAAGVLATNPAETGVLRMNWRTADPKLLDVLKEAMLADGTDTEFLAYLNTLEPDESLDVGGPDDRARAATWGRIPRTYIRLTEDRSMPIALQDRFIAEADALTPDNPFAVHSLGVSHVAPLIHPAAAADILASLTPKRS